MKITVIHGSMRKGNTYGVTQAVLSYLRKHADVDITEISVADLELPFWSDKKRCRTFGIFRYAKGVWKG